MFYILSVTVVWPLPSVYILQICPYAWAHGITAPLPQLYVHFRSQLQNLDTLKIPHIVFIYTSAEDMHVIYYHKRAIWLSVG